MRPAKNNAPGGGTSRLKTLDGLRGLAVLAVILNHVPLGIWSDTWPAWAQPLLPVLLSNGKLGVCFLFLLTGFLMSWLYGDMTSVLNFWSRRLARLLPPYLVMVVSLTLIRGSGRLPILFELLLIFAMASVAWVMWHVVSAVNNHFHGQKWLVYAWLLLQAVVASGYVTLQYWVPAPVFYHVWPQWQQWLATGLVNATFTLPFGRYVDQLDGVYWSLVAEMGFYLLYPTLILPLLKVAGKIKSKYQRALLMLSLFPFTMGLTFLGERLWRFSLVIPYLSLFFLAGTILGTYYRSNPQWPRRLARVWQQPWLATVLLLLMSQHVWLYPLVPASWSPGIMQLLVIPMVYLVWLLVVENGPSLTWLHHPVWQWLGKHSYSLYLTHAITIDWLQQIIRPVNGWAGVGLALSAVIGSSAMSLVLYHATEALYFKSRHQPSSPPAAKRLPATPWWFGRHPRLVTVSTIALIFVLIYVAFRPPTPLFTLVQRVKLPTSDSTSPHQRVLQVTPTYLPFQAAFNNMGMILLHLNSYSVATATEPYADLWRLQIGLQDTQQQTLAQTSYLIHEIGHSPYHPFGFPLIADSQRQNYTLQLSLNRPSAWQEMAMQTQEGDFLVVYFVDRGNLKRQPRLLLNWIGHKLTEPLLNPNLWMTVAYLLPTSVLMSYAVFSLNDPHSA